MEKVAINAVMAGCKPEYLPVVLGALEAALEPQFTLHGLACSTCFSGPVIVVNGPAARTIGMNSGIGALGPGNRANATIGRAVQLIVRNVGGAVQGDLDRSTLSGPSKYTMCFAEDESDPTGSHSRCRAELRQAQARSPCFREMAPLASSTGNRALPRRWLARDVAFCGRPSEALRVDQCDAGPRP